MQGLRYCSASLGSPVHSQVLLQALCVTRDDICPVPTCVSWLEYSTGGSCVLLFPLCFRWVSLV